jgi:hypothetical protein
VLLNKAALEIKMSDAKPPEEDSNTKVDATFKMKGSLQDQPPILTSSDSSSAATETLAAGNVDEPAGLEEELQVSDKSTKGIYEEKLAELSVQLDELRKGINAANESKAKYDSLLQETSAIRIAVMTAKDEIDVIRDDGLVKKGIIETEYNAISKIKVDLESELATIAKIQTDLTISIQTAQSKASEVEGLQADIETNLTLSRADLKAVQDKIAELKNQIMVATTSITDVTNKTATFNDLATKANAQHTELVTLQTAVGGKITEIELLYTNTQKLYLELFTDSVDATNAIVKPSIKTEIEKMNVQAKEQTQDFSKLIKSTTAEFTQIKTDFLSDRTEFSSQTVEQFRELKAELEKEIRSLLPRAGAAGLASTYFDAKSKYASTPFKEDLSGNGRLDKLWHYSKSALISICFYGMFVVPLIIIFLILKPLMNAAIFDKDGGFLIDVWLFRLAVASPLIAVSIFGLSSIRMYRRLYEEYNHKQRVMQLYHSFKDEIVDEDQKKALLGIMLQTVGDKPSLVMPRYEKTGLKKILRTLRQNSDKEASNSAD